MEVLISKTGSKKILHEGYVYVKNRTTKTTIRWMCSKRASKSCNGALVTDIDVRFN